MPTTHIDGLWRLALEKWAEIARKSPDLAPALALQQGMLRHILDAAERVEGSAGEMPVIAARASDKWRRGLPALRGESIPIPASLKPLPAALCDELARGGAGESAAHIGNALVTGEIDAGSLISVSLARNQKAIRTSALHHGFSPDLVWLVGELASSPIAHWYEAELRDAAGLKGPLRDWDRGYCPCCGSWPALIEMLGGARILRCSFCAAAWELTSVRCGYCSNDDGRFVAAVADTDHPTRRIELCGACGNYTKVVDVAELTPFPLIAIEDLATMDLDQGAMAREYRRPSLFDLDELDPPASPCS